jgi:cytochrome P450
VVEDTVDELIDAFVASGATEFVGSFALPLPVRMITRILGFPDADIPRLKAWSTAWVLPFSGPLTDEQEVWVAENVVEFQHYINDQIQLRRAAIADGAPDNDVLTALVSASFDDPARSASADGGDPLRPLTDHEIITIVDHLYIGGNETTTFALTSALWILLRGDEYGSPGLYERVRDDRSLLVPFIEEALRLESPTQGLYRRVAVDTELGGVAVPAGSVVHIRYAAANRDERRFPEPDNVVLDRQNGRRHLAFSLGEHHCPGEGLSRFEQRIALDRLLDRLPDLRLASTNTFTHAPGFVLRALDELHLEWTAP